MFVQYDVVVMNQNNNSPMHTNTRYFTLHVPNTVRRRASAGEKLKEEELSLPTSQQVDHLLCSGQL